MGSPLSPGEAAISERIRTWSSAAVALAVAAAYLAISWDGWLTNFQVRWMCEDDHGFVLLRRAGVIALGIPREVARRDPRAIEVFERRYPRVLGPEAKEIAAYALDERWIELVRGYWGFGVERSELSIVDRADRNRVLATTSLFRRVDRGSPALRELRSALVAPAEKCVASDRAEFVTRVLVPAVQ